MSDLLRMQKNVCLSRHFQSLDKGSALDASGSGSGRKRHLDVWLVDFMLADARAATELTDTTSLFLLQLACIVNMVPRWKRLDIRVFLAAKAGDAEAEEEDGSQKEVVKHVLGLLRIRERRKHFCSWSRDFGDSRTSQACGSTF